MALQERTFLCDGETYPHYYLCNYKPYSEGADKLSYSLIRFKKGEHVDVQAWTDCAVAALKSLAISSKPVVLRALHSHETKLTNASGTALDNLARAISAALGGTYRPHLLQKKAHQPLKGLNLEERIRVIEHLYTFRAIGVIQSIILVDDIFTSGTTMTAIVRSIRKKLSCPIILFTLAATDRAFNPIPSLSGIGYSWKPQQGWIQVQEPAEFYSSVQDLKNMIDADFQ